MAVFHPLTEQSGQSEVWSISIGLPSAAVQALLDDIGRTPDTTDPRIQMLFSMLFDLDPVDGPVPLEVEDGAS